MRVVKIAPLKEFWTTHPDAEEPLKAWVADAQRSTWQSPHDIKVSYANASIIGNERVVFNIRGNNYGLIVAICYRTQIVLIKFIGTHSEHDKVDAEQVTL